MKTWQKTLIAGATLGAAALTLAACGSSDKKDSSSSSSDKVTVKLWVTTDSKKFYNSALADFKKENPNVTVNVIETEDAKAQENVKKDPSKAADVFSLPHDQLGQLVDSGVIQEIPAKYATAIKKDDSENAVTGATYKSKMYAFPYGIESQVLYYNKTKLSADDVKTYEGITSKATFGANLKAVNAYAIAPLFMSVGDNLFGKDGETVSGTDWNNAAGVNVLKWIADQKTNKGFVNVGDDTLSQFQSGAIASFESGPWDKSKAVEAIGKDNLGIAVYPTMTIGGKSVQQKAFLGVKLYAVNQAAANGNTAQIAAAYKLADYLSGEKVQELQFKDKSRNIIPSNTAVQAASYVKSDALAQAVVKMSEPAYTVVMPKIPEMTNFWTSSAAVLSDVYNGKITADQYQAKLDQLVKDISGTK
ncbi:extracellular solute-binding protein [Lactococcus insecticola]|uniref:Maltose ABC transporter substrate-binding protein n=1 Tax=Pseudolactococcus insecticola TaxID=2709158 RepID=A0A6A0B4A0_9LACT|nr:extracellular solute-binding protein [Lactococcus insecticola]GFH40150.1 maltose ABC transporter substrate-binding protein [Lactococcus insecticola]